MNRKIFLILSLLVFVLMFASTVTATTSLTYQYDANGNLISGDGKYYEYNDANQLVRVKYGDVNGPVLAEYVYDYTGQRIKKIDNGVMTYYIGTHFEKQVGGTNPGNTDYYFANGERIAKKDPSGNMYYYHSDHLGGTNVITDSSGNLVERIKYYPFGEIREGGNEKYSFTGKEKDKLTDFFYYESRYYNSDFKHFTQADTVAPNIYDPQNFNRYAYTRNNPVKYVDPSGHEYKYRSDKGREKFKEVRDELRKTDTGRKLLVKLDKIASDKDIEIMFTQPRFLQKTLGNTTSQDNGYQIELSNQSDLTGIAATLSHEAQHVIDFNDLNVKFSSEFDFRKKMEENARVTQAQVYKEFQKYYRGQYVNYRIPLWTISPEIMGGTQALFDTYSINK